MTLCVVLPLSLIVPCVYPGLSAFLHGKLPVVSSATSGFARTEELVLLAWWVRLFYWGFTDPAAQQSKAFLTGFEAVCAQYMAEVPWLVVSFLCCYQCCGYCMPMADDFGAPV
uniref:Secreted protein n=1 Tax=Haptolina brevifila TaxID=156173 RepID=A0A7S2IJS3_9EUKA|mmetsp:Transcript_66781/g.132380  ORF Transcript_66781/g.132380 Transcript_66781/m.132380 type:complete len:113 (+) Transcript_66781:394-732(+)